MLCFFANLTSLQDQAYIRWITAAANRISRALLLFMWQLTFLLCRLGFHMMSSCVCMVVLIWIQGISSKNQICFDISVEI